MQKRYNHAGKQIIADDFIKTRGGGSSASLTKVQTIIGNAKNSKQINELSDKLKYITSDGIISVQEKKTLLREHSTLYSAYINIGNQMKDAGYTVNDNNLYSDLVLKNSELKAVMDRIEATEGDYTVQPDDNIDARFMDCWQAVNNCEYFLSQNRNFASRYSLQVDSLTTEVSDPVSFYANVYEGNVLQTDADFTREEEFSWTREGEGFTERKGCRKLTLYPSDIDGTESKFFCQWKHKMNTVDGTTPLYSTFVVPFLVKIAGLVEYTWSVKSEGLNMEAEVWTRGHVPAKPAEPPTYYLWQRTSKDNGATWELARSNAKPAPEDSDLRSFDIAGAVRNFNRSSRGYVYADQSLTFSIVKRNLSGTPTWSIEPENSNLVLADNQDGTATVTIKRGYEFDFFKIKAKLSDSNVTRTLLIDSAQPAPKRHNFKSVEELPTNDTSNPDYPFIVPDEGLIMIYDYCTWVHTKDTETVNEVMFYNGTGWQNIDLMPDNLKGETALESLPAIMKEPNIKIESKFMNVFCDSLVANYVAANKIDSREYHLMNNGKIYGGTVSFDDIGNPILNDKDKGFCIMSNGSAYFAGMNAKKLTIDEESVFKGTVESTVFKTILKDGIGDEIYAQNSDIDKTEWSTHEYFQILNQYFPWQSGKKYNVKLLVYNYLFGQTVTFPDGLVCSTNSKGERYYYSGFILATNYITFDIAEGYYYWGKDISFKAPENNPNMRLPPSPIKKYGSLKCLRQNGQKLSSNKTIELDSVYRFAVTYETKVINLDCKFLVSDGYDIKLYDKNKLELKFDNNFMSNIEFRGKPIAEKKGVKIDNILPLSSGLSIGSVDNKYEDIWSKNIHAGIVTGHWVQSLDLAQDQVEPVFFVIMPHYHYTEFPKAGTDTEKCFAYMLWKLHFDLGGTNLNLVGAWTPNSQWSIYGYVYDLGDWAQDANEGNPFNLVLPRWSGFLAINGAGNTMCQFGSANGKWYFRYI